MPNYITLTGESNSFVQLDPVQLSDTQLTIAMWLMAKAPANTVTIAGWTDASGDFIELALSPNGSLTFSLKIQQLTFSQSTSALSGIFDGNWHHVAVMVQWTPGLAPSTWTDGLLTIFMDGNQVLQQNITEVPNPAGKTVAINIRIGTGINNHGGFSGSFTDLRIWNAVLDADRLKRNMHSLCGKDDPNLALYLPLLGSGRSGGAVQANLNNMATGVAATLGSACSVGYTPNLTLSPLIELELNTPSAPFPDFSQGGLAQSYQYLSNTVDPGSKDIRSQYTNGAQASTNWLPLLLCQNRNAVPASVNATLAQWQQVYDELNYEFQAVNNFNAFFANLERMQSDINMQAGDDLNTAISTLSVDENMTVESDYSDWISLGIEAIGIVPGGGEVLALAFDAVWVISKSFSNGNVPDFASPISVTASILWNTISNNYKQSVSTNIALYSRMMTDFGIMQAAETYIQNDQLVFPISQLNAVETSLINATQQYFAQSLMTSKYSLFRFSSRLAPLKNPCISCPSNIPADGELSSALPFGLGYGLAVIGEGTSSKMTGVPSQGAYDYLSQVGFTKTDWFGWWNSSNTIVVNCSYIPPV